MTSAELLRGATSEELREAARHMESEQRNGSVYALAAAGLFLIAEGREKKAFHYGAESLEWVVRLAVNSPEFPERIAILRALAGGSP